MKGREGVQNCLKSVSYREERMGQKLEERLVVEQQGENGINWGSSRVNLERASWNH